MAAPTGTRDTTFRNYNKEQGADYAKHRQGYHPKLLQSVIEYHTSHGGKLDALLDVGCGPGIATRLLAPFFAHATGIDPSEGMIANARSLGGDSASNEPIRYEVSSAEHLGFDASPPIADGSIDVITVATAAHWFEMNKFWHAAARVLKPGGTVAIWTIGDIKIHPSVPNAVKIQAYMDEILENELDEYMTPGNRLARDCYRSLPLPWTISPPAPEFDQAKYVRRDYGAEDSAQEFYDSGRVAVNMDGFEKRIGTASYIVRWREAHPDQVGTNQDIVKRQRYMLEKLMQEAGVEKGKELIQASLTGVLLLFSKKA